MPKAYWISAYHAVHDENKLAAYAKLALPAVQEAGGKFIARGMAAKAYEAGVLQRTVIVEFESLEKAFACARGRRHPRSQGRGRRLKLCHPSRRAS